MTNKKTALELFQEEHGKEWLKFTGKPLFRALMLALDESNPIRKSAGTLTGDIVVAGGVLYAECKGYESALRLMKETLISTPEHEEPDPDYQNAE